MSLGIVIKAPEGLVLAAESRLTLTTMNHNPPIQVHFDNTTKLLSFAAPYNAIGVVTYGQAAIGMRTAQSFVPEFEAHLAAQPQLLSVGQFARAFGEFYAQQWHAVMPADYNGPPMTFVIAGFDPGEAYGRVYTVELPNMPQPIESHPNPNEFGITWGGQREVVDRLVQGFDSRLLPVFNRLNLNPEQQQILNQALRELQLPIPIQALPLQDCIDLATFFIRTTISAQNLTVQVRGVGGPIDVAVITQKDGLQFIQRKQLRGELS